MPAWRSLIRNMLSVAFPSPSLLASLLTAPPVSPYFPLHRHVFPAGLFYAKRRKCPTATVTPCFAHSATPIRTSQDASGYSSRPRGIEPPRRTECEMAFSVPRAGLSAMLKDGAKVLTLPHLFPTIISSTISAATVVYGRTYIYGPNVFLCSISMGWKKPCFATSTRARNWLLLPDLRTDQTVSNRRGWGMRLYGVLLCRSSSSSFYSFFFFLISFVCNELNTLLLITSFIVQFSRLLHVLYESFGLLKACSHCTKNQTAFELV